VALRWPIAGIPLDRDEGGYAYIAQRWLQGEVPYRESFDQKTPGLYAAYAVIERALGESPAAIHWGTQLYTLATLAVLFLLGRRLYGEDGGLAAGALAAFMTADHCLLGNSSNSETFMLLPLTAGFLAALLARERESWRWAMACGACTGLALLFKQVAMSNAAFHLALLLLHQRRVSLAAAFLAGASLVLAPVPAYFAAAHAWGPFYECVIGYNLKYSAGIHLSVYPANFWDSFSRTLAPFWPVYLLALPEAFRPGRRCAAGWLAFSFLGVCAGGFFRGHYYLQAVPALALLAGASVARLCRSRVLSRLGAAAPYLLTGAVLAYGIWNGFWYYGPDSSVQKCRRIYHSNPFAESPAVARLIASRTDEQDRVFVFGSEPQLLYYARRKSATRYIYVYPLFIPAPGIGQRQWDALEEVRRCDPKMVVTLFVPTSFLASSRSTLGIFESVQEFLRGYHPVGVMPFASQDPPQLVTGDELQRLWQASPLGYGRPGWASLAVWEKNP